MAARRALLATLIAALPAISRAQGQGQGQGQGRGAQQRGQPHPLVSFTAAEQAVIAAWLAANAGSLTPLPPGIARNLARGKPLPPGIARRAAPQSLRAQLVARPGFEVLVIGTSVVLAEAGSLRVNDLVAAARR